MRKLFSFGLALSALLSLFFLGGVSRVCLFGSICFVSNVCRSFLSSFVSFLLFAAVAAIIAAAVVEIVV